MRVAQRGRLSTAPEEARARSGRSGAERERDRRALHRLAVGVEQRSPAAVLRTGSRPEPPARSRRSRRSMPPTTTGSPASAPAGARQREREGQRPRRAAAASVMLNTWMLLCRGSSARGAPLSSTIRPSRMRDPARAARGDLGCVGDHEDRRALGVELVDQRHDGVAGGAVEVAGRLVGEHDRRPADQRARDRDALALTARELRSDARRPGRRARRDASASSARARLSPARTPAYSRPSATFSSTRRVLGQEELLEDEADARRTQRRDLAIAQPRDVDAGDRDAAGGGALERADQVQQRRLARSRGADDRDELARAHTRS